MEKTFEILRATRDNFLRVTGDLSLDAWNEIPARFNNNIVWNFGHTIASRQVLCYQFANVNPTIDESYMAKYKNGTKPETVVTGTEIELLKTYFKSTLDQLEADYKNNVFKDYKTYTTRFGVQLTCIEDAIRYLCTHEALHYGCVVAIKKLVINP